MPIFKRRKPLRIQGEIEYIERAYLYKVGKRIELSDNKIEIMLCPHYAKNRGRVLIPDSDVVLTVDKESGTDNLLPMFKEIAIAWRIPETEPEVDDGWFEDGD